MHRIAPSACIWLMVAAAASAQTTYDWNNASGGNYGTAANWSPAGGPPSTTSHIARFPLANTYTVTFGGNYTIFRHTVVQGNVTWNLNNFTFQNTDTLNNGIGNNVTPTTLRVLNGTWLPGNLFVANSADVVSTLTLDQGADVTVGGGACYIGTTGAGVLNILNGSTLTTTTGLAGIAQNSAGVATVNVTGAGSTMTINNTYVVGGSGNGTLNVTNGATTTVNALNLAESQGGVGLLNVTGAGATFTSLGTANIGGTSNLFPAASATVNVGPGATANFNGTTNLRTNAVVNVASGTLNLNGFTHQPGSVVNWSAGKIQFANAATITPDVLNLLVGGTNTLGSGRTLVATSGTLQLDTPLVVNGGTLTAPTVNVNAHMTVGSFGSVSATDIMSIGATRTVQVSDFGRLGATTAIFNDGLLQLNGPSATVTGFTANNFGVIQGTGRFTGGLNNGTGGTIRARAGDHLIIDQVGPTNPGNIELSGGVIEYTKVLSNLSNGFISGRGEFRGGTSNPGGNGLSNQGIVALSAGYSDIRGDVINSGSGRIIAAGGSVVTFYDDVTHNGAEIRVNGGARAVFFGGQSGAGPFTGSGVVEYNGDLRPGNSPANVSYGGDVAFSPTAHLMIELGGVTPGAEYDRLTIAGEVTLGNAVLEISLINGFVPQLGQSFTLIDNQGALPLAGTFAGLPEGGLFSTAGVLFQASYFGGNGNDFTITPVPEPACVMVIAAVGSTIWAGWRRSRRTTPNIAD